MKKVYFISLAILISVFIQGCASGLAQSSIRSANKTATSENYPYEYVLVKDTSEALFYSNTKVRGEVGKSQATGVFKKDIDQLILKTCNYKVSDLIETRIAPSQDMTSNEIWVYKDEKSEMEDKTTAMGIRLKQLPNNGGVDMFLTGECPKKITSFIFAK